ncbi:hypothetical protein [Yoonia litorea]|uniref:Uncharacterized protein n=1 Tax=Yoonia litorea TaxID=1123755 RepID=A0A1I6MX29_9RHOB|nr:hypothetical protein [Yoonia litorea]SFS20214.1 hypothetical protein SAMN05444714_2526 [Yoonia litorea]
MSIKSLAVIAATIAATATTASADSFFGFKGALDPDSALELGLVRSANDGIVEIYDFHRGELGQLLGAEMVTAGANADVRVDVGVAPINDVIALLKVDGEVVAEQRYFVEE